MSDAPSFARLAGRAIPFNRIARVDGGLETIDPGAFDGMIADGARVRVLWDSHDADAIEIANGARLFSDGRGLAFECLADVRVGVGKRHWALVAAVSQVINPHNECSVGDLDILAERWEIRDGVRVRRVLEARIGHVAICRSGTAAYGRHTGFWRPDRLDEAAWHIQAMAAEWQEGRALATLQAKRRGLIADAERLIRASDRTNRDLTDAELAAIKSTIASVRALDRVIARGRQP
jgi:phage head maturation protease